MRSRKFLFVLNTIVVLLTNTWNSRLICRLCHFFFTTCLEVVCCMLTLTVFVFTVNFFFFFFFSSFVEHMVFNPTIWLYVILFYNAPRYSDLA